MERFLSILLVLLMVSVVDARGRRRYYRIVPQMVIPKVEKPKEEPKIEKPKEPVIVDKGPEKPVVKSRISVLP